MPNVTPITSAKAPQLDPHNVATAQLWRLRGEPRDVVLDETIDHLMINHDMTEHRAENAALQALAELETLNTCDIVDLNATTTNAVVLSNGHGSRVVLTVRDIRRLLNGQDLQAGNKETGRLLLLES